MQARIIKSKTIVVPGDSMDDYQWLELYTVCIGTYFEN